MEHWISRRSAVYATKGLCSSSQSLASAVGVKILQAGGNAADAAVAIAAALNVTEPCSTGIGGDAFALYYEAKTKKVHCLQGNGASAADFTLENLRSRGFAHDLKPLDPYSGLCVTVPGAAALWDDLISQFGSLSLEKILQPAVDLAEQGFPVGPVTAEAWNKGFIQGEEAHRVLRPNGNPIKPGQIVRNPDLAQTFRTVASKGAKEGFYNGYIAEAIEQVVAEYGGLLNVRDLQSHRTLFTEPISTVYKGIRVYQTPPPSHGLAVLLALNILSAFESLQEQGLKPAYSTSQSNICKENIKERLSEFSNCYKERYSVEQTHITIEAMRRAYADALQFIGDPVHPSSEHLPLATLLSPEYALSRAQELSLSSSTPVSAFSPPGWESYHETLRTFLKGSDTVYFSTVDSEGNACSFINSNYMTFGTGIMPKGCGFTLQNRGYNFSLLPTHLNVAGSRKRPYHTIIPGLATFEEDQSLYAVFGNMGGFMQPMGHVQLLRGLIDCHLDPQHAVDAARWTLKGIGKTHTAADMLASHLDLEEGYGTGEGEVITALQQLGHNVSSNFIKGGDRGVYGKAQVIVFDQMNKVYVAGSDPRADGCAMPVL